MPTFSYIMKVRVNLSKFESPQELMNAWRQEAQAVLAAGEQMDIQMWKDAGEPVVYGVASLEAASASEAHADALSILTSVPMGAAGQIILEEMRPVIAYSDWAETLAKRASG